MKAQKKNGQPKVKRTAVAAREARATSKAKRPAVSQPLEPEGTDPWSPHQRRLAELINARRADEVHELSAETEILQAVFELRERHDDDGMKRLRNHARTAVLERTPFGQEQGKQFDLLCEQMEGLLDVEAPIPTLEDWYQSHAPMDIHPDDLARRDLWRRTGEKRLEFAKRWRGLMRRQFNENPPLSGPERQEVEKTLATDFVGIVSAWLPDGMVNREWPITRELRRAGGIVPTFMRFNSAPKPPEMNPTFEANVEKACSAFKEILWKTDADGKVNLTSKRLARELVIAGYEALGGKETRKISNKKRERDAYVPKK